MRTLIYNFILGTTLVINITKGCKERFTRSVKFRPAKEEQLIMDSCRGLEIGNFCEFPSDYPHQKVLAVLKENKNSLLSMMFSKKNDDFQDLRPRSSTPISSSMTTPQIGAKSTLSAMNGIKENFMFGPEKLCRTNSSWIRPRTAKSLTGNLRYIINSPGGKEEYSQYVYITQCLGTDVSCDPSGEIMKSHVKTRCSQEYTEMKLIVLGEDQRSVEVDTFRFPSCCSCEIVSNIDLSKK